MWHLPAGVCVCVACGRVVLSDGRVVPRVSKYKHLGTVMGSSGGPEVQRERVLQKLRGILSIVCSLEVTLDQMVEMTDCVIEGVVGFYGRSTPLSREFCEKVEKCRRAQFVRVGKRRRGEGNCEVHAEHRQGRWVRGSAHLSGGQGCYD